MRGRENRWRRAAGELGCLENRRREAQQKAWHEDRCKEEGVARDGQLLYTGYGVFQGAGGGTRVRQRALRRSLPQRNGCGGHTPRHGPVGPSQRHSAVFVISGHFKLHPGHLWLSVSDELEIFQDHGYKGDRFELTPVRTCGRFQARPFRAFTWPASASAPDLRGTRQKVEGGRYLVLSTFPPLFPRCA